MFQNYKITVAGIALVLLGAGLFVGIDGPAVVAERISRFAYEQSAAVCQTSHTNASERVQCWLNIVQAELQDQGIDRAYRIFTHIYDTYPDFGSTGCHKHAHTLGDTAYYEIYVARGETLQEHVFPPETKACGHGFFHGFIEHLVQDNPDKAFVVETCTYLKDRYGAEMPDLENICYHASGHGYMQAVGDSVPEESWGNITKLVKSPLAACSSFTDATARQREECREGVFNVISDWMIVKNFGLSFDENNALAPCNRLPRIDQRACYFEFGMKLATVIKDEPERAAAYVENIPKKEYRLLTFGVMIAGMMERKAPLDTYNEVFSACAKLTDTYFEPCIVSSVHGMFAHGSPGTEHEKALAACRNPALEARDGQVICYRDVSRRIVRTMPYDLRMRVCEEFPEPHVASCKAEAQSRL